MEGNAQTESRFAALWRFELRAASNSGDHAELKLWRQTVHPDDPETCELINGISWPNVMCPSPKAVIKMHTVSSILWVG